jgi:tight adherence protein C
MDQITSTLNALLANFQDQQTAFVIFVAVTIFIFSLGLSFVFIGATNPIRRRLDRFFDEDEAENEITDGRILVKIRTMMGTISHWVMPNAEDELNETTKKLSYAGHRGPNALQTFYGIKALLTIGLPICVLVASRWLPEQTTFELMFYGLAAAGLGLTLPSYVLDKMVTRHMTKLRRAFPDALDLLVVCVESGLGLAAAIQRVADELMVSHPDLSTELALVNAEMRAGVDRSRALKNLADRTGLVDIRGLVSLLVQTMRFGTGVADALRVYSEEFRDKRMQAAEEQAALIGTKLIFPLVLCLFPSFFIVAIGPAVLRLIAVFGAMGTG